LDEINLQDAALLNLQRACDACVGLAMRVVRLARLGVPQDSAESFALLASAGLLDEKLADRMKKMVGFRNVIVHEYQKIDLAIVRSVIERDLDEVLAFSAWALRLPTPLPPRGTPARRG